MENLIFYYQIKITDDADKRGPKSENITDIVHAIGRVNCVTLV